MTYRGTSSPLIAVYEDSGQTISNSGKRKLDLDTVLHNNGSLSSNTFTIDFNTFLTCDMKSNGNTGFGGRLLMDVDGTEQDGKGSVISGDIPSTGAGASNEIIASNVVSNQTVEIYLERAAGSNITLDTFTRILGVITI